MFDDLIENNLISKYMVDSTTESDAGENDQQQASNQSVKTGNSFENQTRQEMIDVFGKVNVFSGQINTHANERD